MAREANVLYGPADGCYYTPGTHRSQVATFRAQDGRRYTPFGDYSWQLVATPAGYSGRWVFINFRQQPAHQDVLNRLKHEQEHRDV